MGNNISAQPQTQSQTQNQTPNLITKVPNEQNENLSEDEIFEKILHISDDLFLEYNNEFLKEDFCSKIALVYEKKLSNFNIKLLKSLHNNINTNNINNELAVTLQYLPKHDEKFTDFNNIFKDTLEEKFWNKNIEWNPDKIISNDQELKEVDIIGSMKYSPKYIQFKHVNNLLSKDSKNNNLSLKVGGFIKKNNHLLKKMNGGGENLNNYMKTLNEKPKIINNKKKLLPLNEDFDDEYIQVNNEEKRRRFEQSERNKKRSNNTQNNNEENNNEGSNNERSNNERRNNKRNNNEGNNNEGSNNEGSKNEGSNNKDNKNKKKYVRNNKGLKNNSNFSNQGNKNNLTKQLQHYEQQFQQNKYEQPKPQYQPPQSQYQPIQPQYQPPQQQYQPTQPQYEQQTQPQPQPQYEKNNLSLKKINEITNKTILKNLNTNQEQKEKDPDNKEINTLIKYSVPRKWEKPTIFCENSEKCQLTKKELCQSITENFIVRNNIIAAILTTIPYKNEIVQSNGKTKIFYEGGICYQKFLNLDTCKVCVPYDYRELKNKNIKDIIIRVLEKAENLDEERCRENEGYFLKLTKTEKEILQQKALKESNPNKNNQQPQKEESNYNLLFIEFTKKLKTSYFDSLNSLITILEKMKETPIINNATLNLISNETKSHIDNMYNLCHYYYVYGIISLINADVTEDVVVENKLKNMVRKALNK